MGKLQLGGTDLPAQKQSPYPLNKVPNLGPIGQSLTFDTDRPRSFLLQKWTTIRATSPITTVTQEDAWMDLSTFADAAFWVEVGEVTNPSGGTVSLVIESSPTMDETCFQPIAPPLTFIPSSSPNGATVPYIVRCVRTPTTVPLSRWTRWRLKSSGSGTWDATFRIRGTAGAHNFFQPTMINGCFLWLRADLGVSVDTDNSVISWADQSGFGTIAQGSGVHSARPQFNLRSMAGQPTVSFDSSQNQFMFFNPAIALPPGWGSTVTAIHAFIVHRRIGTGDAGFWTLFGGRSGMPLAGKIQDDCWSTVGPPPYDCGVAKIDMRLPHVYEVLSQDGGGIWANWLNGIAQFSTAGNLLFGASAGAQLGLSSTNNTYYNGDWAEMFLFAHTLTTAERGLVIDYLNGRYGLGAI